MCVETKFICRLDGSLVIELVKTSSENIGLTVFLNLSYCLKYKNLSFILADQNFGKEISWGEFNKGQIVKFNTNCFRTMRLLLFFFC